METKETTTTKIKNCIFIWAGHFLVTLIDTDDMILDHDPIFLSDVYRLECLKFETATNRPSDSLTRIKSRDASALTNEDVMALFSGTTL